MLILYFLVCTSQLLLKHYKDLLLNKAKKNLRNLKENVIYKIYVCLLYRADREGDREDFKNENLKTL